MCEYVCSGNSLDSSPNYTAHASKSKVRKGFEGLIRRLSGGRDSQVCLHVYFSVMPKFTTVD